MHQSIPLNSLSMNPHVSP